MSEDESMLTGGAVVASALAGQLGSSPEFLQDQTHDMRILSVIEKSEIPFYIFATLKAKKSKAWATVLESALHLNRSVGGRGLRDIIRMESVSHGGASDVSSEIAAARPGWVGRNVSDRNWQEDAERDGKI